MTGVDTRADKAGLIYALQTNTRPAKIGAMHCTS